LAASLPGNELYENTRALARFYLAREVRQASDQEALKLIGERKVNFERTALTAERVDVSPADGMLPPVRVVRYEPDWVEVETNAPGAAFLVAAESYYPGWDGWIDGKAAKIYRTDVAFRGMAVPGGKHRIVMRFEPDIFRAGAATSFVVLVLVAAGLIWPNGRFQKA
jgi:hypothetical protein